MSIMRITPASIFSYEVFINLDILCSMNELWTMEIVTGENFNSSNSLFFFRFKFLIFYLYTFINSLQLWEEKRTIMEVEFSYLGLTP